MVQISWTTPKTWSVGETLTAANFNTHIRDNMNALFHLIVRKTSDQSVTSSTTVVNDSALSFSVAANEHWDLEWRIYYEGTTTGDFKFGFTFPTGGRLDTSYAGPSTAGAFTWLVINTGTSPTGTISVGGSGAGNKIPLILPMLYVNGGTAGTLQLQWAQDVSDATPTKVLTDSGLWGVKLA